MLDFCLQYINKCLQNNMCFIVSIFLFVIIYGYLWYSIFITCLGVGCTLVPEIILVSWGRPIQNIFSDFMGPGARYLKMTIGWHHSKSYSNIMQESQQQKLVETTSQQRSFQSYKSGIVCGQIIAFTKLMNTGVLMGIREMTRTFAQETRSWNTWDWAFPRPARPGAPMRDLFVLAVFFLT